MSEALLTEEPQGQTDGHEAVEEPPFQRLGTLLPGDRIERRPGLFQRFDFHAGTVTVPALLWSREEPSERLVIAFNGAVRRTPEKDPREIFQRRTWVEDIDADVLFIADPTLRHDNRISIGWGQGAPGGFALPAMAQTARFVAECLEIPAAARLYYGTSAGGFQALQAAARDDGCRVLVNNPQFDWTKYLPMPVATIAREIYAGAAPEAVAERFPDRTSTAHAFAEFGHVPRTRCLLNAASENDALAQLPALIDTLPAHSGERSCFDVSLYSDARGGHNPLSRSATAAAINAILSEATDE
ncbi:hypothetical protein [Brevibacterium atlanticum]|uniref:hypothetical protein n=1 Tax=Brevibacterium atlanticum TaxID=2697563 RepID=UPI0014206B87|nr:hypothetical protein [Brevibacterium atlanticum]